MSTSNSLEINSKIARLKPIRPSKLSVLFDCPWQYLLSTERNISPVLEKNPIGVLGSAMHKIIENYAGQHSLKGLEVQKLIANEFEKKISLEPNNLLKRTFDRLGIDGVINPKRLLSATQLAYKSIIASPKKNFSAVNFDYKFDAQSNDFLRENRLSSSDLDLEGWPDLVYKKDSIIYVVDYKLGLRRNADGKPKESYIFQAAAYGLLAKERFNNGNIILELISPSEKWTTPLDNDLEAHVRQLISQASRTLPIGELFDATQVAQPGMHCGDCSFRPGCPSYNNNFLAIQLNQSVETCSNDVCGKISSIQELNGLIRLEIESNFENRKFVVEGLDSYDKSALSPNSNFIGYGLGSTEIKGRGTYVSNFHIFNVVSPSNSAFSSYVKTLDPYSY
jgi:CRISPR/Cas system-associated exonuclease Cas4 (RecB family)